MAKKIKKKEVKKTSTYQKLKAKNEDLENDIYLLLRGKFSEKTLVEMKWNSKFDFDEMVWYSAPSNTNTTFDGFISKITNGKD